MEETKNTQAIILNRQAYRENDSLVTLYTPDQGKLSLIARGTKKISSKLAGHIEPLTLADIMIVRGKGFNYLGSAVTRETFQEIRSDLNRLYYAGQAINIFSRGVLENESDGRLFFLLVDWLKILNNFSGPRDSNLAARLELSKENGELLLAFFTLKLLTELGYKPEMYKCVSCSQAIKSGQNYFNLANGGMICSSCLENDRQSGNLVINNILTISDYCVKIIRFIIDKQFDQAEKLRIDKKLIKELSILVKSFLNFCF